MSEMVERVGEAIIRLVPITPELAREAARAAIEAMREPTEAMVTTAHAAAFGKSLEGETSWRDVLGKTLWPSMIDEALK